MKTVIRKVMVLCRNAAGEPDAPWWEIELAEHEYLLGGHLERAEVRARAFGYEGPYLALDQDELGNIAAGVNAMRAAINQEESK